MQSNNPVFRRSAEFNGSSTNQTYPGGYGQQGYGQQGQQGYAQPGYSDPSTWDMTRQAPPAQQDRMTIDSVVQATGVSLGVVIVTAFATWLLTPEITAETGVSGSLMLAFLVGSFGAFAMSLVNSFKRVISPALVLVFAVLEGMALGGLSKIFDAQFGDGVVTNAVLGTFAAFIGTLAAYKFLNIQVSDKFRKMVVAAMFGMVALGLLELMLSAFGASFGLFETGALGLIFAVAGLALGVFMLILDFDFVEKGIAAGLEQRESWRAAFAMTVSLVWIYTNLLRLMAIFSSD
ncbi:Bax inhibitor-1/YccA family protein [Nocardioides pacificus]